MNGARLLIRTVKFWDNSEGSLPRPSHMQEYTSNPVHGRISFSLRYVMNGVL